MELVNTSKNQTKPQMETSTGDQMPWFKSMSQNYSNENAMILARGKT